ncbi:HIT family protein [Paenibacillus harenae]|uniref:HIT family protein n=1 Tax=Paenibacillus harenae TaxID=306543 RepID=UPI00041E3AD9|nr:HIT family protein [Paenibacillus harenae]
MECLGCKIANQLVEVNIVYEDSLVTCVLDIAPFNEGHLLILPKAHVRDPDELPLETLHAIMNASVRMSRLLKKVYHPDGITICQNGGLFNDLNHYHMHVIPRFADDGFIWSEPLTAHGAENRLKATCSKLRSAESGM